tara:strand:- start:1433 stop:2188 length:756 start_codon:yes stop_codon:yes gene_type:complete
MSKVKYCKNGIEGATVTKRGARILLQGHNLLLQRKDPVYKQLDQPRVVSGVIGINTNFMYKIEQIGPDYNIIKTEEGIGVIVRVEEGLELIRIRTNSNRKPSNMYKSETYLRISTCMPTKISDFETPGNSVLVFNQDESITSIPLAPNTFLGRFLEDDIRDVPVSDLLEIIPYADILDYIQQQEAQLKLNTRRLDLTNDNATVSAPILRVTPDTYSDTNRPIPQQGMIIYNQDSQTLEYYDGEKWRSLVFV